MSRVFVARDESLGRQVVVKLLMPELAATFSVERFTREIKLAAGLQHANIVPVITAGAMDGLPYYTMPYIDGLSLHDRLANGPAFSVGEAVKILGDVARALDYAQQHGVVHRDIKPANILLSGGTAVVTDFGIAKAIGASRTQAPGGTLTVVGTSLGTPAYMAPEQAVGDEVDARADIYAWGIVAYEMLSAHPFAGKTTSQQLVAAHIAEKPKPLGQVRRDVPAALASVVMKALEKSPDARPQSAQEIVRMLEDSSQMSAGSKSGGILSRNAPVADGPLHRSMGAKIALAMMAVVALGALTVMGRSRLGNAFRASPNTNARTAATGAVSLAAGIPTVAVLPFSSTGGEAKDEYFSDGMTDELAHALSRLPSVRVAARTSSYAFKGKSAPVQEIGKVLHVAAVIEGAVRRSGDRLRVTAQLTSSADGLVLWSGTYESRGRDVFQVQDSLTKAIVGAIAPALRGENGSTVVSTSRGTDNAEAYDLYLKGRYFWARRGAANLNRAIGYFKEAIGKDPGFARAHAGLAMVYVVLPFYTAINADSIITLGIKSGTRALGIDSTLADAHMAIGYGLTLKFKSKEARRYFESAIRLEPGNATAPHWYGLMFRQLGNVDSSLTEGRRAAELDPLSPVIGGSGVAYSYYLVRRMPEAIAQARRVLEIDSTVFTQTYRFLGMAYLFSGKPDSALLAFETEYRLDPASPTGVRGRMVLGYAATGRWRDAERIRADIAREQGMTADFDELTSDLAFGDWDGALSALERAKKGGYLGVNAFSLGCDPLFDPLKASPRFAALISQLGIRACKPRGQWPIKVPANLLRRSRASS